MGTIKTAFKSVEKTMLGSIGVAIAVVDYGFCLAGVEILIKNYVIPLFFLGYSFN
jgi:hypothetical protein